MSKKAIKQIIEAIKNFDIARLNELLDDDIPYMEVTKSLFLSKLEKKFNIAKKNDCYKFDDIFFGICGFCNKGCEGMTFLSESGYYLDLYIESKDEEIVDDIYVCNKLINFTDLEKSIDLGFSFCKDEYVDFKPSTEYKLVEQQYDLLLSEIQSIKNVIKLDDFIKWYDDFHYLRGVMDALGPFESFNYKLYSKVFNLTGQVDNILNIKTKSKRASDGLINYQSASTEREKLVWFFENQQNHYGTIYFEFPKAWKLNSYVYYKTDHFNLAIDLREYEYVMDYFLKLDRLFDDLMEKYKPLPEHFEQSETGSIEYSLENHLRIHNQHLDIVDKYGRKKWIIRFDLCQ